MTTPRIIFVPGMKPKPPPDLHRRELLRALVSGLSWVEPEAARMLVRDPDIFRLVSWTHRFYGSYRNIGLDVPGIDRLLQEPEPSEEDRREIDSTARRVRRLFHLVGDAVPLLGRLFAKPELRLTMAEVRRYFADEGGIATDIRNLLRAELLDAARAGARVLLIGHSLGSVIAYDSLWELTREHPGELHVDLFITLGSPLATRFIRRSLRGAELPGKDRYPANVRRWINFTAKGETIALRRRLRRYFTPMITLGLLEEFEDVTDIYNHFRGDIGLNVHKSYGYLAHELVAACIARWLLAQPLSSTAVAPAAKLES